MMRILLKYMILLMIKRVNRRQKFEECNEGDNFKYSMTLIMEVGSKLLIIF